ncbi:ATP-binding protein [Desulfopila inferna]|uniref:ATP-binding protein n=1 Tax=Desulfopila inferna TaxID=468528 RepID=UPI001964A62F|nr:ATP-binding protein [Desulfopila inferna]MBM9604115.1 ATP-binding protein [Desulfopila inferna]
MKKDITYLGRVINVSSSTVEVEIDKEIPSAAPIINGRVYKLGQIGTFVKFPIGNLTLFGIVTSVTNIPSTVDIDGYEPDIGSRFLQLQLVGERLGDTGFQKGIGTFPTINDEVHIVVEDDLKTIYGNKQDGLIEIGKHSASDNLSVFLDLHHLVLRHSAILGSTGSGKSNTTAKILSNILNSYPGSRIVLIDPHGEYSSAFKGKVKVFKINGSSNPLYIPFWAMNFDELSFFLVGRQQGAERPEDKRLREEIVKLKKDSANKLKAGAVETKYITEDSPIPFDIRKMWYTFNREIYATYSSNSDHQASTECLTREGDAKTLTPAIFEPYSSTNTAPFKSKQQTMFAYEKKLFSRLKDTNYDFMFNPGPYYSASTDKDIDHLLREWIDHNNRLTILDLNEVPFELTDITVGLITRFLFDSMYWGRNESYTGRNRPLLMVYEEAHSYLPKTETSPNIYGYARKAVEKLFKEGRKFGIGAMVITQRPSEISQTILAQVGTFIALRLTNSSDKSTVQSAAPNNMTTLMDLLPSLRIGESIIVGESINIPSRVKIELMEPRPSSNDPDLVNSWTKEFKANKKNYTKVVKALREKKHIK